MSDDWTYDPHELACLLSRVLFMATLNEESKAHY